MSVKRYRRWLDKSAGADSYVHISGDEFRKKGEPVDWELKLADCSHSAVIYFQSDDRKVAFSKLEVLESALVFLRERMEEWNPPSKV